MVSIEGPPGPPTLASVQRPPLHKNLGRGGRRGGAPGPPIENPTMGNPVKVEKLSRKSKKDVNDVATCINEL